VSPSLVLAAAAATFLGAAAVAATAGPGGRSVASLLPRATPDLSRLDAAVLRAAAESKVDPDLLRGLVAAESGGDPRARSGKGAVGLLQLTLPTAGEVARDLGLPPPDEAALEDPETNLRLGARYLARLLDRFGDEAFAVAAYNAGPTPVRRWRERAADASAADAIAREGFSETRSHVVKTLRFRDAYRAGRRGK
jgi:soluble lytic murein transglycosylase